MGEPVTLPHTWNAVDGQDGGNDYYRGTCCYTRTWTQPKLPGWRPAALQLDGAAMTAERYRERSTAWLTTRAASPSSVPMSPIPVPRGRQRADHRGRQRGHPDTMYPASADFTFYGGIYRGVNLISVPGSPL